MKKSCHIKPSYFTYRKVVHLELPHEYMRGNHIDKTLNETCNDWTILYITTFPRSSKVSLDTF